MHFLWCNSPLFCFKKKADDKFCEYKNLYIKEEQATDAAIKAIEMGLGNDAISKFTGITDKEINMLRRAKNNLNRIFIEMDILFSITSPNGLVST